LDKWNIVFNCYKPGTLKCSPTQPKLKKYKTNSLHSLTNASLCPLQGITLTNASLCPLQRNNYRKIVSVADKLLDETIWFSIPANHPTNAIKLKNYCNKLKTRKIILDLMLHILKFMMRNWVIWSLLHLIFSRIIAFSNLFRVVKRSFYVKGTHKTKVESLSQPACGINNRTRRAAGQLVPAPAQ